MRGFSLDGSVKVGERATFILAWQAMHQVNVEIVKTRRTCTCTGCVRLCVVVNTAQRFERSIVETLDPDRQAINATVPVGPETAGFG